jgi:predicted RNase H-like nuclease (RuvC/YqgF family)
MNRKLLVLALVGILIVPLALSIRTKAVEYGDSLENLDRDVKAAATEMGEAKAKVDQALNQSVKAPSDKSRKATAKELDNMVGVYENQISTLEEDLRIVKVSGEALLQKIFQRTQEIKDAVVQKTELERIKIARARLDRQLVIASHRINQARAHLAEARDAALVAANAEDLGHLTDSARSILSISDRAQSLVAALQTFARDNGTLLALQEGTQVSGS